jgi:hypothetical protein
MLNFWGRRVKCISWYFSGANVAPCVRAQAMHFSFALSRTRQFASVDLLNVSMLVSSTKPIAVVAPVLSCGRRVEAKKRKRSGDSVEPWGMPDVVGRTLSSYVPSMGVVVRLVKKERMYSATHCGSLASRMLWISRSWETLSKAPEMSRLSMLATKEGSFAHASGSAR